MKAAGTVKKPPFRCSCHKSQAIWDVFHSSKNHVRGRLVRKLQEVCANRWQKLDIIAPKSLLLEQQAKHKPH